MASSMSPTRARMLADALEIGSFFVETGYSLSHPIDAPHPVHERVIRPLLARATECRLYGLKQDPELLALAQPIATPRKGIWFLDLSRELLRGYEPLWNGYCRRDSIVIVTSISPDECADVFTYCRRPDVWSSFNMICEGNSRAAVKHCREVSREGGQVAFCFSGSNALEWMDVFAPPERLEALFHLASARARSRLPG